MHQTKTQELSLQQSEYNEIKAKTEPYWHLFNFALDHEIRRPIVYLTTTAPILYNPAIIYQPSPAIVTEYANSVIEDGKWVTSAGALAYPPGTPTHIRRQSQKFNWCDNSIKIFLYYLLPLMQEIGAKIEWLTVTSNPRVVYHWFNCSPRPDIRHSVFLITSRTGEQYVADFTIEQFGFEEEMWFTKREEYMDMCTLDIPMSQPTEKEVDLAREGLFNPEVGVGWVVMEVIGKGSFWMWERLDWKYRVKWLEALEALVKETSKRKYRGPYSEVATVRDGECVVTDGMARAYYFVETGELLG
jgi:hypothetical protein